jgi:anaerobic dimethyl sulfoxide reductase subunit B (iron-sulfur subunit)
MSTQYGFSFIKGKCIQCFGCEVACKSWRGVELGVKWRRVHNIWYGHFPNVKNASASISCMHCVDPVCVKVCPVGAIKKQAEDGVVVVDRSKCTGCKTCLKECPFGAPQFGADGRMQKCDMCMNEVDLNKEFPPCIETCPSKALQIIKMDNKEKITAEQEIQKLIAL